MIATIHDRHGRTRIDVDRTPTTPHVTDVLFRDTVTARMLRKLCEVGSMSQADFMKEYHVRCERPERPCFTCKGLRLRHESVDAGAPYGSVATAEACQSCKGSGIAPESRSSFVDNFGRFVHSNSSGVRRERRRSLNGEDYTVTSKPLAAIGVTLGPRIRSGSNMLAWTDLGADVILSVPSLTNKKLHDAFASIERQMVVPRKTDNEHETARWMERIRAEIHRRTS